MSIESELRTIIRADLDVFALVGERIYPVFAPPKTTTPYIVLRRISTPRLSDMLGAGTPHPRFNVSCWDDTYDGAIDLATEVRLAIDGVGPVAWGALTVQRCSLEDEYDTLEPSPELEEQRYYGRELDFEIWHTE